MHKTTMHECFVRTFDILLQTYSILATSNSHSLKSNREFCYFDTEVNTQCVTWLYLMNVIQNADQFLGTQWHIGVTSCPRHLLN